MPHFTSHQTITKNTLTKSMRENVYANIYCVSFPLFHSLIQKVKEHAKRNMLGYMSSSVDRVDSNKEIEWVGIFSRKI